MDTSDMKKGLKFMYDGQPYVCVEFQFVKPGKGQAFTRTKMRHLLTGSTVEKNIRSGEKISPADAEERSLTYIFPEGDMFVFMNNHNGEQVSVAREVCGDAVDFLIDGIDCQITFYQGNAVAVSLPSHVIVQIVSTEPGFKGDTATNVLKPAKIVTGATIQVPLFVSEGEWVKVDTRTHEYTERVKGPAT
jgi:elongation factor P